MNNNFREVSHKVQEASYINDDLVLWWSKAASNRVEELFIVYKAVAPNGDPSHLQQVLNILDSLTKQWLVRLNAIKIMYRVINPRTVTWEMLYCHS